MPEAISLREQASRMARIGYAVYFIAGVLDVPVITVERWTGASR